MRQRANSSGVSLSAADAAIVKGMLRRGDRQHDIAAWFGVNGGRIAEVAAGYRFYEVVPAPVGTLPPAGPYPKPKEAIEALAALDVARLALARAAQAFVPRRTDQR